MNIVISFAAVLYASLTLYLLFQTKSNNGNLRSEAEIRKNADLLLTQGQRILDELEGKSILNQGALLSRRNEILERRSALLWVLNENDFIVNKEDC